MNDEQIRTVIEGILGECKELGPTPRARILDYLARTAPVIENNVQAAPPMLRGDEMIVVELPKELFARYVANDRAYRLEHGHLSQRRTPNVDHYY